MSTSTAIFWPVIAQALLTLCIYGLVSKRRIGAIKAGTVAASQFKVPFVEPEPSATVVRNLTNQFELPVLFYVVCLSQFLIGGAGYAAVGLAWVFVLSRIAHAYVHVTSNRVGLRRQLFIVGVVVNLLQWGLLAFHLI